MISVGRVLPTCLVVLLSCSADEEGSTFDGAGDPAAVGQGGSGAISGAGGSGGSGGSVSKGGSGGSGGSAGGGAGGGAGKGAGGLAGGGTGGASGASGGGTGGKSGTGGASGMAGKAGTGGASGTAGKAGSGGAGGAVGGAGGTAGAGGAAAPLWISAYYAGWMATRLPPAEVDFSAMTHVIHFAAIPTPLGGLDTTTNNLDSALQDDVIARAHKAGRKALLCVGGAGASAGFKAAAADATLRMQLVASITLMVTKKGYDGVDIDWEPFDDAASFAVLIADLRASLNNAKPGLLLTAPVADAALVKPETVALLDQLNIMTYDLSGAYAGWVTWHNAPIFNAGAKFPSTGGPLPSVDGLVSAAKVAKVPLTKMGIGIDFYGYVWKGAFAPLQPIAGVTVDANIPYYDIMTMFYAVDKYKFDAATQASYLAIDAAGTANDRFISYDDEVVVQKKTAYAKQTGLGGVIVWEIGGGYRPEQPVGKRDLLLQALKK